MLLAGYLKYEELMKALLDFDYFALYTGGNDTTQATADLNNVRSMVRSIKDKFKSSVEDLRNVLFCMDAEKTGERSSSPLFLFSKSNKTFLGYLHPVNMLAYNKKQTSFGVI